MAVRTLFAALFAVVSFVLLSSHVAEGKVSHGHVKGYEFVYLDKFCFYGNHTHMNFTITSKYNTTGMYLLLVDDEDGNWTDIYKHKHKLTCQEKLAKAHNLSIVSGVPQYEPFRDPQRPHFWYFAAVQCGQQIDVKYEFTFIQDSTSNWIRQFSFEEQGLEALYLVYFIFFLLGAVVHGYTIWTFMQTGSYHLLVRIFTSCVCLEGFSWFFYFIHYASYSSNGHGVPFLKGLGEFLDICAQIIFILLVVLIAKGWCISKTSIDNKLIVLAGLGVLVILYLSMFIWAHVGLDPASTLYIYQSAPGIIIIIVRVAAMMWFVWSIRGTYMEENNAAKRKFYVRFAFTFIFWFLVLPLITAIAGGIDPWVREKTVMALYVTFNFLFLVVIGVLLWPSRAGEYFQISDKSGSFGSVPYDAI